MNRAPITNDVPVNPKLVIEPGGPPLDRVAFIVSVLFWAMVLDVDEAVCRTRDAIRDWRHRRAGLDPRVMREMRRHLRGPHLHATPALARVEEVCRDVANGRSSPVGGACD